jgi:hypothetical protein
MGGVFNAVGDVVEGVADFAGDVVQTAIDNPLETAAIIALPYLAGEALAGETLLADTFGSSTAADIAASELASSAAYTGGTGLSQTLLGSTPGLTTQAIAEGAVPVATQGLIGAGGTFNPFTGSLLSNIIPSTPTDFITAFIPKTPGDIAKTLGTSAVIGTVANTLMPKPEIPGVDMNIPSSNVPQYGTGRSIFNAYNDAKNNISDILNTEGLLGTQQPRNYGIYSNYLQQQGLI